MAACFTYKQHATVSVGGIEGGLSVLFACFTSIQHATVSQGRTEKGEGGTDGRTGAQTSWLDEWINRCIAGMVGGRGVG